MEIRAPRRRGPILYGTNQQPIQHLPRVLLRCCCLGSSHERRDKFGVGMMRWLCFIISEIFWVLAYTFRAWSKSALLVLLFSLPAASATMGQVSHFISTYCPSGWYPMDGTAPAVYSPDPFYTMMSGVYTYTGSQVTCHSDGTWHCHVPDFQGLFFRVAADGQGPFIGYNNSPASSRLAYTSTQTFSLQGHYHKVIRSDDATYKYAGRTANTGAGGLGFFNQVTSWSSGGVLNAKEIYDSTYGGVQLSSETRPSNVALLACVASTTSAGLVSSTSNYYVQYSSEVVSVTLTPQDLKDFENFLFIIFFFWLVVSAWRMSR